MGAGKDRDAEIGQKLSQLFKEKGTNAFQVSKATGIDDGYLYRMISGERDWKLRYLEKILDHLEISLEEFFGGDLEIPVVANVSATKMFLYPQAITGIDKIRYRGRGKLATLKGVYALRLEDKTMMPAFKQGTEFICQKDTWDLIEDEDMVVASDENGQAQIYRVHFVSNDFIMLRAFNPATPDRTLPRNHLKLCDRVLEIILH